jgi:hypothetical protein
MDVTEVFVGTHRLHAQTIGYLRDNFNVLLEVVDDDNYTETDVDSQNLSYNTANTSSSIGNKRTGIAVIQAEFPGLLEKILDIRSEVNPKPPSTVLSNRLRLHAEEASQALKRVPFPFMAVVVCGLGMLLYVYTGNTMYFGPYVPYFNAFCIALGVIWFYF